MFFLAVSSLKARMVRCSINVLSEWMLSTDRCEPLGNSVVGERQWIGGILGSFLGLWE